MAIFAAPGSRLLVRALLAGVGVALAYVQTHGTSHAALWGAISAAAWALIEYVTPVNKSVGVGKGGS